VRFVGINGNSQHARRAVGWSARCSIRISDGGVQTDRCRSPNVSCRSKLWIWYPADHWFSNEFDRASPFHRLYDIAQFSEAASQLPTGLQRRSWRFEELWPNYQAAITASLNRPGAIHVLSCLLSSVPQGHREYDR
jgi:hypothetical protein